MRESTLRPPFPQSTHALNPWTWVVDATKGLIEAMSLGLSVSLGVAILLVTLLVRGLLLPLTYPLAVRTRAWQRIQKRIPTRAQGGAKGVQGRSGSHDCRRGAPAHRRGNQHGRHVGPRRRPDSAPDPDRLLSSGVGPSRRSAVGTGDPGGVGCRGRRPVLPCHLAWGPDTGPHLPRRLRTPARDHRSLAGSRSQLLSRRILRRDRDPIRPHPQESRSLVHEAQGCRRR